MDSDTIQVSMPNTYLTWFSGFINEAKVHLRDAPWKHLHTARQGLGAAPSQKWLGNTLAAAKSQGCTLNPPSHHHIWHCECMVPCRCWNKSLPAFLADSQTAKEQKSSEARDLSSIVPGWELPTRTLPRSWVGWGEKKTKQLYQDKLTPLLHTHLPTIPTAPTAIGSLQCDWQANQDFTMLSISLWTHNIPVQAQELFIWKKMNTMGKLHCSCLTVAAGIKLGSTYDKPAPRRTPAIAPATVLDKAC